MNVQDVIFEGISTAVIGLVVVFSVLILIMLVIYAMAFFSKKKNVVTKTENIPQTEDDSVEESNLDKDELIAVITAAVAACMGKNAASVNIRSYKKVSSAWNDAAKREILTKF